MPCAVDPPSLSPYSASQTILHNGQLAGVFRPYIWVYSDCPSSNSTTLLGSSANATQNPGLISTLVQDAGYTHHDTCAVVQYDVHEPGLYWFIVDGAADGQEVRRV